MFLSPNLLHFQSVNQIKSEGKSPPQRIDSSQQKINPDLALAVGVILWQHGGYGGFFSPLQSPERQKDTKSLTALN